MLTQQVKNQITPSLRCGDETFPAGSADSDQVWACPRVYLDTRCSVPLGLCLQTAVQSDGNGVDSVRLGHSGFSTRACMYVGHCSQRGLSQLVLVLDRYETQYHLRATCFLCSSSVGGSHPGTSSLGGSGVQGEKLSLQGDGGWELSLALRTNTGEIMRGEPNNGQGISAQAEKGMSYEHSCAAPGNPDA